MSDSLTTTGVITESLLDEKVTAMNDQAILTVAKAVQDEARELAMPGSFEAYVCTELSQLHNALVRERAGENSMALSQAKFTSLEDLITSFRSGNFNLSSRPPPTATWRDPLGLTLRIQRLRASRKSSRMVFRGRPLPSKAPAAMLLVLAAKAIPLIGLALVAKAIVCASAPHGDLSLPSSTQAQLHDEDLLIDFNKDFPRGTLAITDFESGAFSAAPLIQQPPYPAHATELAADPVPAPSLPASASASAYDYYAQPSARFLSGIWGSLASATQTIVSTLSELQKARYYAYEPLDTEDREAHDDDEFSGDRFSAHPEMDMFFATATGSVAADAAAGRRRRPFSATRQEGDDYLI
jgi:hypothetical protein